MDERGSGGSDAPFAAEGVLLRWDLSERRRDPLLRVTTFVPRPHRNDLHLNMGVLVELGRKKEHGFCCGGGGARMWMEEKIGTRVNRNRSAEIIATGAEVAAGNRHGLDRLRPEFVGYLPELRLGPPFEVGGGGDLVEQGRLGGHACVLSRIRVN